MDLTITGRHVEITDAMRDYARQRTDRLSEHFLRLSRLRVMLTMDNGAHTVEFIATPRRGNPLVARGRANDMYAAINVAADKMEAELRKLKDRVKEHRVRQPATETAEATGGAAAEKAPPPDQEKA